MSVSQRAKLYQRLRSCPTQLVEGHKRISSGVVSNSVVLSLTILVGGCGVPTGDAHIQPEYDKQTGRLQLLKYDSNSNGKVDTVSYMDGARILRIEIDKDEDGKVERWEYYDADRKLEKIGFSRAGDGKEDAWSFAGVDGSIVRIEMSTARDGRVTRTEHYERDALTRAEEDGDGDGRTDKGES